MSTVSSALSLSLSAAAASATATSSSTPTSVSTAASSMASSSSYSPSDQGECSLLGSFALLVQAALGGLALLALVYKRWRERPQRPLKIWFFDVSKQVFGSVLVHISNIFMSMLTSGRFSIDKVDNAAAGTRSAEAEDQYIPNPCSWYLLNLAVDTTLGIPILILLLRLLTVLLTYTPFGKPAESIQSGNYGSPPSAWWWLKQSVIYFIGLFGMKLCVLIIFVMLPWISKIGDWALSWTEGNEEVQIAFVMMIFPLIMNGLQYYIIDSCIKKKEPIDEHDHERLPTEDPDDEHTRLYDDESSGFADTTLQDGDNGDHDDDVAGDVLDKRDTGDEEDRLKSKTSDQTMRDDDYDPVTDSDARTVIGSTSTSHAPCTVPDKTIEPELYPKE